MLINQMTVTLLRQTKNLELNIHQMVQNQIQMVQQTHVVQLLKVCSLILITLPKVLRMRKLLMRIKFLSMKETLRGKVIGNINSEDSKEKTGKNTNGLMLKMVSIKNKVLYFFRTLHCLDENSRTSKFQKTFWQNRNRFITWYLYNAY